MTSPAAPAPLFPPPSLIPAKIQSELPAGYTLRPLAAADHGAGFLDVLRELTSVGDIAEKDFRERYDWLADRGRGEYFVIVVEDPTREPGQRVVGTGALVVERKFIHNLGLVGHIEDIAVAKDQRGKKLGLRIIHTLDAIAEQVGCYKTILDCSEANEGFYVKCGYKRVGVEMAHYYAKKD